MNPPGPNPATPPSTLPPWLRPAISLASPSYRLMWLSQFTSGLGFWMELVTTGWLVFQLTGSGLLLGVVTGARSLPLLFLGALGGVFADRFDRRRQIAITQGVTVAVNLSLGLLVWTGFINEWHLLVGSLISGAGNAFQSPARQSLLPQLVPRQHLLNAVALHSGAVNVSRSFGPAVAGLILGAGGALPAYAAQALSYLVASLSVLFIQVAPLEGTGRHQSLLANLLGGLRYAVANRTVLGLLLVSLIPYLLAQPYVSLMPIFAERVLNIGASGLGLLLAAPGIGALMGLGLLAAAGDLPRKGLWLLRVATAFGLSLVLFAASSWLPLSLLLLLFAGLSQTAYNTLVQTLLQTHTPDAYRGRVMSLYLLDRGVVPLGSVLIGAAADAFGAPAAVALLSGLCVLLSLATALRLPEIRRL